MNTPETFHLATSCELSTKVDVLTCPTNLWQHPSSAYIVDIYKVLFLCLGCPEATPVRPPSLSLHPIVTSEDYSFPMRMISNHLFSTPTICPRQNEDGTFTKFTPERSYPGRPDDKIMGIRVRETFMAMEKDKRRKKTPSQGGGK